MGLGMNVFQGMIGRSCLCVCLLGQMLYAEDQADPEADLRAVLAEEPLNPRRVLDTLIASPGMFDSESDTRGFSVELLGRQADGTEVRLVGDFTPGRFRGAEFRHGELVALRADEMACVLRESEWTFIQDGAVRVSWSDLASHGEDDVSSQPSRIAVSFFDMLGSSDKWTSVQMDPLAPGIRATSDDGETCLIALRTPHDVERYGSLISHVSYWRNGQLLREFRRPARTTNCQQRLAELDLSGLQLSSKDRSHTVDMFDVYSQFRRGDAHLAQLGDEGVRKAHGINDFMANTHQKPVDRSLPQLSDEDRTTIMMQTLGPALEVSHAVNQTWTDFTLNKLHSDDPAANWWRMELSSSHQSSNQLAASLLQRLAEKRHYPLDDRIKLADQLGDLGRPCILWAPSGNSPDRHIIEAVLFSRWEYPCQQSHIDACVSAITPESTSPSKTELAAIESLLRMNRLDLVPQDRLELWWNHHVVFKGTRRVTTSPPSESILPGAITEVQHSENEARGFDRWETMGLVSRFPTGRKFLLSRLDSSDPPITKRKIWSALQQRAESTLRQQRFDFMSRQECEEILAIPQVPEPGRDSESGMARPFPTLTP